MRTLHTLLKFNVIALEHKLPVEITFVKDDAFAICDVVTKMIKKHERVIFIGYSIFVDEQSLIHMLAPKFPPGYAGMVLPTIKEGINWAMFKEKIRSNSNEPVNQMGLEFDTEVDKKIVDDIWSVKSTSSVVWSLDSKMVVKALRERKGDGLKIPLNHADLLNKLKLCTYIKSSVLTNHTHECISNIVESAGIKVVR